MKNLLNKVINFFKFIWELLKRAITLTNLEWNIDVYPSDAVDSITGLEGKADTDGTGVLITGDYAQGLLNALPNQYNRKLVLSELI